MKQHPAEFIALMEKYKVFGEDISKLIGIITVNECFGPGNNVTKME
jgi:hypothetical protein